MILKQSLKHACKSGYLNRTSGTTSSPPLTVGQFSQERYFGRFCCVARVYRHWKGIQLRILVWPVQTSGHNASLVGHRDHHLPNPHVPNPSTCRLIWLARQWNLASFLVAFWPRHQAICVSLPFKQMTVDVASLSSAHLPPGRSWAQTSPEKHWFCKPCLGFYTCFTTCFTDNNTTTHQITKKETSIFPCKFLCFCSPKHPFFQVTNEEVHVLVDKTAPCWAEFPTSPRSSGFHTDSLRHFEGFFRTVKIWGNPTAAVDFRTS